MNKEEYLREARLAFQQTAKLKELLDDAEQVIILGNGGSNAVASHLCQDYTKQLGKEAFTFSDPSRLTCYINDYGMENANRQFLKEFADNRKNPLVIIISSSGNSENMVNCAKWCDEQGVEFVTLSGFKKGNKLDSFQSEFKELNYHVNSCDYGVVECVHALLLHSVL